MRNGTPSPLLLPTEPPNPTVWPHCHCTHPLTRHALEWLCIACGAVYDEHTPPPETLGLPFEGTRRRSTQLDFHQSRLSERGYFRDYR